MNLDLSGSDGVHLVASHKLAGESYVDRILVLDGAKGGVATAWMLHDMRARGIVPRALISSTGSTRSSHRVRPSAAWRWSIASPAT